MKKFYATLPSGQDVSIPEDTLEDFRVLYRGVAIRNTPYTAPLVKLVDTRSTSPISPSRCECMAVAAEKS